MASSEALDVLHQVMHAIPYHLICMATEIASDFHVFFVIVYSVVANNLR